MNLRKENKKLHVALVLDESGSMASVKKETISGVNEQIQELKHKSGLDVTVTLVTFSGPDRVQTKYLLRPLEEVQELTDKDYNPDGGTAMYDGVARCISSITNAVEDDDYTNYLALIVSDGEENSSIEFTAESIAEMIKEKKATKKWSINYIGANQDLTVVSKKLDLNVGTNTLRYSSTVDGTRQMWNTTAGAVGQYYTSVLCSSNATQVSPDFIKGETHGTNA